MKEPLFILGAGRSGTTLLYKLIALHKEVAYVSNFDARFFKWLPTPIFTGFIRPFPDLKRKVGFINSGSAYFARRPLFKKIFPMPVEGESIYKECDIPLYVQNDYQVNNKTEKCLISKIERITKLSGASIFISKRTANNRRIDILKEIFPGARFLHLIRDGRAVALSLSKVDWWDGHRLWWSEKTPKEHERSGENRLSVCAKNWVYEVNEIKNGLANIDEGQKLEIRYEQLLSDPVPVINAIVNFVGLQMESKFIDAVKKVNIGSQTSKWKIDCSAEEINIVSGIEEQLLRELGYM